MSSKNKYFVPENKSGVFKNEISPDGKFQLIITSYFTKKDCWNYTQGLIYKIGVSTPLFEVQRNYSMFPFLWVDHPNGHQYLVCGEDYQGQSVLELDTGKRKDILSSEAKNGCGFCWADYRFDVASRIIVVSGCVWACPYEYKFYDFSDPMSGWPELETDMVCIDEDDKWPIFETNGNIKKFIVLYMIVMGMKMMIRGLKYLNGMV
jgi:hypothetical protein